MRTRLLLGITFLSLLIVAGCTGAQSTELAVTCDQFASQPAITQSAEISAGRTVTVSLCSNKTTGYSWDETIDISDPSVAKLASRAYEAPDQASPALVGAAGTEVFTFDAVAAGTTTISMHYGRPWEGGDKAAWTYTLTLTVK